MIAHNFIYLFFVPDEFVSDAFGCNSNEFRNAFIFLCV